MRACEAFLAAFQSALRVGTGPVRPAASQAQTDGALPSAFAVTDFAVGSIASAVAEARRVATLVGGDPSPLDLSAVAESVDARQASLWFDMTLVPNGWRLGDVWDDLSGIYEAADRPIRLHTNAASHRRAAETVIGHTDRASTERAVARWPAEELQEAIYSEGGVAVAFNTRDQWATHHHGETLATEPLVHVTYESAEAGPQHPRFFDRSEATPTRPLAGVRVLDLTRVLAGPAATRFLAGLGADVLRIDPETWNEPAVIAEVTLGKRCAHLDLKSHQGKARLAELIQQADILVHGYRLGALDNLGFGSARRRTLNPALVDVSLNAWGHTGPWSTRRGFDSIVQIASGVAHAGGHATGVEAPRPLPVQALDHATGYTLAACALRGWRRRLADGQGSTWCTSLAAHAELLCAGPPGNPYAKFAPIGEQDLSTAVEQTSWGTGRRVRFPVAGLLSWPNGATELGTSSATWRS